MKKDQALKFWDALDDNTSLKVTLSSFENKKGYGDSRTLQRYAQAHEGFKEDVTSDVIARKTGWSVKYIEKIRPWWEQKYRKQVRSEQKPGDEISSRQREEAQRRQELLWESSRKRRARERGKIIGLIEAWLEELATFSPVHLLQARLDRAYEDAQAHYYTDKDVEAIYLEARQPHRSTIKPLLEVQDDPAFMLLRMRHRHSKVWIAFRFWRQQETPYSSAFYRMLYEAESVADEAINTVFTGFDKEVIKSVDWIQTDTLSGLAKRFAFKRSVAVLALCDYLVVGIAERPPDPYWINLIDDLEGLRLRANVELSAVTGVNPKGGWSSGLMDLLAESPATPRELTATFLDELAELRLCEMSLIAELRKLKSSLESLV